MGNYLPTHVDTRFAEPGHCSERIPGKRSYDTEGNTDNGPNLPREDPQRYGTFHRTNSNTDNNRFNNHNTANATQPRSSSFPGHNRQLLQTAATNTGTPQPHSQIFPTRRNSDTHSIPTRPDTIVQQAHIKQEFVQLPGRWTPGNMGTHSHGNNGEPTVVNTGKVFRHKARADPWNLKGGRDSPVYAPAVPELDIQQLLHIASTHNLREHAATRLCQFVPDFLSKTGWHSTQTVTPVGASHLSNETLQLLVNNGHIREFFPNPNQLPGPHETVRAFLVPELRGGQWRQRTIFHTITANESAPTILNGMRIKSIEFVGTLIQRNNWAVTRDGKSFYHQFRFEPEVSAMYIIRNISNNPTNQTTQRWFTVLVSPMGHKTSAAAAHATTTLLTQVAVNTTTLHNTQITASSCNYDTIIDDMLMLSKEKHVVQATVDRYDALAAQCNITLGTKEQVTNVITYRGVTWDLVNKTQRLKNDIIEKLMLRKAIYTAQPTHKRLISLIGTVVYAYRVIRNQQFIPFMRHVIREMAHGRMASTTAVHAIIDDIIMNNMAHVRLHEQSPIAGFLISDATTTTIAAIYVDAHGNVTTNFMEITNTVIHAAEAQATLHGLELVPVFNIPHILHVITDNTIWLYNIDSAKLPTSSIEHIAIAFNKGCETRNVQPRAAYIDTHLNASDDISRRRQTSARAITTTIQHAIPKEKKE